MSEAVLIATLGTEPQVVTLALDALLSQGVDIARVVVVHTCADDDPMRSSLVEPVDRALFLVLLGRSS